MAEVQNTTIKLAKGQSFYAECVYLLVILFQRCPLNGNIVLISVVRPRPIHSWATIDKMRSKTTLQRDILSFAHVSHVIPTNDVAQQES